MNDETRSSDRRHRRTRIDKPSPVSTSRLTTNVERAARRSAAGINNTARALEAELVRFRTGDRTIDFNVDITRETVWATQHQIADLFDVNQAEISRHITTIFDSKELDEDASTHAKMALVYKEGGRSVTRDISHYSLDLILSVGYRVDSRAATDFRRWATAILRSYITKGYSLNELRLKDDSKAANTLSARLRAIRSGEKHVFARVREFFKTAASDYNPSAKECRSFYALLQDKCHYAASGYTASQLILNRADHRAPNLGMKTFDGDLPTIADTKIGKNYLSEDELYVLHIVGEQFLLHVESKAVRRKIMTMNQLAIKFDELLKVGEYAIFCGYGKDYERGRADKHAVAEYARFMVRQRPALAG